MMTGDTARRARRSPPPGNSGSLHQQYQPGAVIPFVLIHVGLFGLLWFPATPSLIAWLVATYVVRMFGVTAGYHRYFSHRSYRVGRVTQFAIAFLAQTSAQKGVLWWAAHHRDHHRNSDLESDIHSPGRRGFWWAHVGWILSNDFDGHDEKRIADFSKFPELVWLDRHHWVPATLFAAFVYIAGGPAAFIWGFVASTVVLYHATFTINSLAHIWGSRRFETHDDSRNNLLLAIITLGEGWHNNHHFSMGSCRQGFRWWEIDLTYLALRTLSLFGVVRGFRPFRRVTI